MELNRTDRELYDHGRRLFEARYELMSRELLERYGRAEHAHLRLPLPAEVVADLLETHYGQRFVGRQPAVPACTLRFDVKISGRGWQTREPDPVHGVFRWSGSGLRASVDLPLTAHADGWLKVPVVMHMREEILASLQVTVNEHVIHVRRQRSETGTRLEGPIAQAVLARRPGGARVGFEVAQTVMPRTVILESHDDRLLGIAVNWVEIESLTCRSPGSPETGA